MTEELHKFLNDHNVFHPLDTKGGYIITYNGFKCFAQLTTTPNVEMLAIRPVKQEYDIGAGSGQTIYREFRIKSIDPNEAYNKAIDDATLVVIKAFMPVGEINATLLAYIISELEVLKK